MFWGTWWCSCLGQYTTNWKVVSSNPNAVTGIFHSLDPSSCIMALGSTQPLKETSTRNTSCQGRKAAGAQGCQPYQVHVPTAWKSWRLELLKHCRTVQTCMGACFSFKLMFVFVRLLSYSVNIQNYIAYQLQSFWFICHGLHIAN
jgi:hypothetical protein